MGESGATATGPASSAAADVLAPVSDPVIRGLGSAPISINQPNAPQNIPRTPPSHERPLKCPIVQPPIAPEPHQRTNQIMSSAFTSARPAVASHCPMQSRSNRVRARTHRVRNEARRVVSLSDLVAGDLRAVVVPIDDRRRIVARGDRCRPEVRGELDHLIGIDRAPIGEDELARASQPDGGWRSRATRGRRRSNAVAWRARARECPLGRITVRAYPPEGVSGERAQLRPG